MARIALGGALSFLVLFPFALFAQTDQVALRAQIRSDLMVDPRTSDLSAAEIDSLVSAIAEQAQLQGVAEDYLEGRKAVDYRPEFAAMSSATPSARSTMPSLLALLALCAVVGGLAYFIIRHARTGMPPAAAA